MARDVRALRPVASHDRPLRRGAGRDPPALRPRRQHVRELRGRQGQAVRRLQPRRLRDRRRDPLLPRREQGVARRPALGAQLGRSTTPRRAATTSTLERDERTAVNPTGRRKLYRYQVQGPTALEVLEKANGGPLPEIKFFNMGELTIGGHAGARAAPRHVRRPRHGALRARGRSARRCGPRSSRPAATSGCARSARASTRRTRSSRAGSRARFRRCSPARRCARTASGCPANGYEATGSLGGSFYSDDIEDYYLTPYDLGYGSFVKFDHDFIGREALEQMADEPPRRKVTLAWNGEDVAARDRHAVREGRRREVHRLPALELLDVAERPADARRPHGRRLDVLRLQLQRALVPLARGRRHRRRDRHRGRARLGRGGRRLVEARRRAARPGRDPRGRQPVPVLRGARARRTPRAGARRPASESRRRHASRTARRARLRSSSRQSSCRVAVC